MRQLLAVDSAIFLRFCRYFHLGDHEHIDSGGVQGEDMVCFQSTCQTTSSSSSRSRSSNTTNIDCYYYNIIYYDETSTTTAIIITTANENTIMIIASACYNTIKPIYIKKAANWALLVHSAAVVL